MSFVKDIISQEHLPLPLQYIPLYNLDDIMKRVCALLNADGGWIVLGVGEDKMVVGLDNEFSIVALQQHLTNMISPVPLVYTQEEMLDDKRVVLLTVMKGGLPPYSYKGRYYMSKNDMVVVPDYHEMASMIRMDNHLQEKWEQVTCMTADVADLDAEMMRHIYDRAIISGRVVPSKDTYLNATLSRLHLVSTSSVSNGAMALFGVDVKRFLTQCRVRIQVMLGGKAAGEYQDMFVIEDNLLKTHQKVLEYINVRLPRKVSFSDVKGIREEGYTYPADVVDEAVTNALIHRSYSGFLDEVTIFIYRDRIEISNPGEMPRNYIVKGKVLPHGSTLRNPLMAEIFYMAGLMEKTGRGLMVIYNGMQKMGYKKPVWKCANGYTMLTLYSKHEKVAKMNQRIIDFISKHAKGEVFTKSEYMNQFEGISKITAQSDIKQMIELHLCEVRGNGPSTRYLLVKTYQ